MPHSGLIFFSFIDILQVTKQRQRESMQLYSQPQIETLAGHGGAF